MPVNQAWAATPSVAAYAWEAERNGIHFKEYPEHGDETPLAAVFTKDESDPEHVAFVAPVELIFRAVPVRPDHATVSGQLPMVELKFEPGQRLIWQHKVVQIIGLFGAEPASFETLVFGKLDAAPSNTGNIMQIWPDGSRKEHLSLDDALQHV